MNDRKLTLPFTKKTTSSDLIRAIASEIGLISYLDFRLFLILAKGEERRIEDDEFLYRVLKAEFQDNNIKEGENELSIEEDFNDSENESKTESPAKNQHPRSRINNFFGNLKEKFNKGIKKIKTETKKIFSSDYK